MAGGATLLPFGRTITVAKERELSQLYQQVQAAIESESQRALSMAATVAHMPPVQRRFAARDRAGLSELMAPVFDQVRAEHAVEQFHFHLPPATSFLRLHKPGDHGDDLTHN